MAVLQLEFAPSSDYRTKLLMTDFVIDLRHVFVPCGRCIKPTSDNLEII